MSDNPIKAIIFDCDGTLIDSEPFHYLAWWKAFQQRGYELSQDFYIHNFSGIGDAEISKIILEILGFNDPGTLLGDKHKFFADCRSEISPIAATIEFATQLFQEKKSYGLKLAVASGARKEELLHNLQNLNIAHYFDVILSGKDDLSEYTDPEGTNKPKPYVYLKTAKMLGCKPEECVALEDSRTGVSSALTAGCLTIAIPNHYTRQHNLSHAHLKIESFADISVNAFFTLIGSSFTR